jgi:hypothetical protein
MRRSHGFWTLILSVVVSVLAACGGEPATTPEAASTESDRSASVGERNDDAADEHGGASGSVPIELGEAELDAFERGFAREIELVRAAKKRGEEASSPEERGKAAQEEWEDSTAPRAAEAIGMAPERYRAIREVVTGVLETLDLQGKIDGPMEIDLSLAPPEMRARLEGDAFAGLSPSSAAALRARLDRLAPLWSEYMSLGAVAG